MGSLVDRRHREINEQDIKEIAEIYRLWRNDAQNYKDIKGLCKSSTLDEIRKQRHVLTPGRYVEPEEVHEQNEPYEEKIELLTRQLKQQFEESNSLQLLILERLSDIEHGEKKLG
jgi:type I restriction enzyme M protein